MEQETVLTRLSAMAERVVLPNGLVLDDVALEASDLRITSPFAIDPTCVAQASVRVSQESLRSYLEATAPGGLSQWEVRADEGRLKVGATAKIVFPIRATAVCLLTLTDDQRATLVLESAEPAAARPVVEKQLAQINPIIDVSRLGFDLRLREIEVLGGSVTIRGTASAQRS